MKTLSVFVAVAIVLTVMCSQQSSAVPVLQGEELEETIFLEIPDVVMDETVMDSMKVRACSNTPDSDLKLYRERSNSLSLESETIGTSLDSSVLNGTTAEYIMMMMCFIFHRRSLTTDRSVQPSVSSAAKMDIVDSAAISERL
uniref:Uncharacterized protein n=1 Tax=Gouania willdenowi TaxID=441366 RepID=A0A8C5E605_GOUWI